MNALVGMAGAVVYKVARRLSFASKQMSEPVRWKRIVTRGADPFLAYINLDHE